MNYRKIYDALVDKAKNRNIDGYVEVHHILPLCVGGTNDKHNLVKLTAREHFVAHQLLHKIYPDNDKLLYAIHMMTVSSTHHNRVNNRLYEWIRIKHAKAVSTMHKNKVLSEETKTKMSIAAKKRGNNGWCGRKHSKESKAKMSITRKLKNTGVGANNSNASEWKITRINGESFVIKSLKTYCAQNNLTVYKMRNNKYNEYKVEKL